MSGTFDSVTETHCQCGTPGRLAKDSRYPIVFDSLVGEYGLDGIDGRWRLCLYHCPWCGGRLPSRRHTLFTDPDPAESAKAAEILSGAKTLDAVVEALGKPDRTSDCDGLDVPEFGENSEKRQRSVHQYLNRWTTLDLHVIEYDDNSIRYAISGKYNGPEGTEQHKSRWWPPWPFNRPPT